MQIQNGRIKNNLLAFSRARKLEKNYNSYSHKEFEENWGIERISMGKLRPGERHYEIIEMGKVVMVTAYTVNIAK